MTTTYPPVPSEMGTFLAQLGAIDVMNQYRAGTLPEKMRRFVDLTIDQVRLQGDDAQEWVDGVVNLTVREWAAAQDAGDTGEEARSMTVASCTLAALMLESLMVASH